MPKKRIFVDNPDPAGPEIDPETNTIDVGGGMFGSRENIPPPPYGQDKGDNRRYQHPSLQASRGGTFNPSMSQFSSEWFPQGQQQKAPYVPGQTPTAEQEALQEPAIDPVVLAAGGVAGGLENVMNKPFANMAAKIVSRDSGGLGVNWEPSLVRMAQNFGEGAWNTGKSGALVQAINNYLMPQHPEAGKAVSLPVSGKLVDSTDRLLGTARREQIGGESPPSIVDKFGKPIFDESGKMIPWSEAEKAPSKAASKINWTNVGDMLKKLMSDIGEVE